MLAAAAEYLLRFGWTRSYSWEADRRYLPPASALGAIAEVCSHFAIIDLGPGVSNVDDFNGLRWFLHAANDLLCHLMFHAGAGSIDEWNDDPRRTADEVVAHLLLAAESCRPWASQ